MTRRADAEAQPPAPPSQHPPRGQETIPIRLFEDLQMKHEQLLVQYGMVRAGGLRAMELQAHAYDLGLFFFGISTVLTGWLLVRAPEFARWLGVLLGLAGAVYLIGSTLRFLAPAGFAVFQPAYGITILAETAFALALLTFGMRLRRRHRALA